MITFPASEFNRDEAEGVNRMWPAWLKCSDTGVVVQSSW